MADQLLNLTISEGGGGGCRALGGYSYMHYLAAELIPGQN